MAESFVMYGYRSGSTLAHSVKVGSTLVVNAANANNWYTIPAGKRAVVIGGPFTNYGFSGVGTVAISNYSSAAAQKKMVLPPGTTFVNNGLTDGGNYEIYGVIEDDI